MLELVAIRLGFGDDLDCTIGNRFRRDQRGARMKRHVVSVEHEQGRTNRADPELVLGNIVARSDRKDLGAAVRPGWRPPLEIRQRRAVERARWRTQALRAVITRLILRRRHVAKGTPASLNVPLSGPPRDG